MKTNNETDRPLGATTCSASWSTAITVEDSEECEYRASWRTGGLGLMSLWEDDRMKAKAHIARWWSEGKIQGVMAIETRIKRVETFTQNAEVSHGDRGRNPNANQTHKQP